MGEIGKACSATILGAHLVPLAHHLVAQSAEAKRKQHFVIQYYKYEKISQGF